MASTTGIRATLVATAAALVGMWALAQEAPTGRPAAPNNPYVPPACTGIFTDVACPGGFAVNWIEEFYSDGITAGCNAAPLQYCPDAAVTRAQMAVFVEKAMRGTATWTPGDLGSTNTGLGAGSLFHNSPYSWGSTAIGYRALYLQSYAFGDVDEAAINTAVGSYALYSNQPDGGSAGFNGTRNTAVGRDTLFSNTTGYQNAALGFQAGLQNVSGWGNTLLGNLADVNSGGRVNATAIGYNAKVDADNKVRIGNTSVTAIGGQVDWTAFSDARGKKEITDLDLGLDFVMALRPVSYRLKNGNDRLDMGFVAQDIEALLGDAYNILSVGGDADRTLALRRTDLLAPIVKAIQEQQATIDAQRAQIARQQADLDILRGRQAELAALKARLAAIEERLASK